MKKITFILLALLGVGFSLSCGNSNNPPFEIKKNPPGYKQQEQPVYTGEELYSQKCIACHGSDGNLGISGAKKISESTLSQVEREELISNGKKTMPPFKEQLSSEEIKKLAEYTFTLK